MQDGSASGRAIRRRADEQPLWVRWGEFTGRTAWRQAAEVHLAGPWLVVVDGEGGEICVPDHIVRGHVELRWSARRPAEG